MAVGTCNIPSLLMENVTQVIDLDKDNEATGVAGHGVHSTMLQKAGSLNYWLVRVKRVRETHGRRWVHHTEAAVLDLC